jgi:hypothetical protein
VQRAPPKVRLLQQCDFEQHRMLLLLLLLLLLRVHH